VDSTVRELAELVRGTIHGDGEVIIHSARTLQDARPGDITFVEDEKHTAGLHTSQASAAIVPMNTPANGKALIRVADPLMAFVAVVQHFQGKKPHGPTGIDARAVIAPTAQIGESTSIGPFVSIGENTIIGKRCRLYPGVAIAENCRIGDDVILHPNVVLYADTILGDRVIVHANAVLGSDGFGYRFLKGRHVKVPQLGQVILSSDVEIGACTTIDRGAFQATTVGEGTKIDNLVQIAHNCKLGKHNVLASQVGIAGSSATGDYVVMGGQVGIKDHIQIGDAARIGAKSGIIHNIPPRGRVFGYPAMEEGEIGRILAAMKRLPAMRKDLLRVMRQLGLKEQVAGSDCEPQKKE
jgi:UDP-3-O-[3-hydroxymyristoyl] glucosamine N-acyltransferase